MKLPTPRFGYYGASDKNVGMMLFEIEADRKEFRVKACNSVAGSDYNPRQTELDHGTY
jgi:hypothetical protein